MSTAAARGPARAAACREFVFTDEDFRALRSFVREHTGISLGESKRELVYNRLSRRLRALGLSSFAAYRAHLGDAPDELGELTNAITTNLTSFFRECHHFDQLRDSILPGLLRERASARRLRIWSAGCSTGEEPFSIAITLRERIPHIDAWDVKILATDLDSAVLERAREGVYPSERVEVVEPARLRRWFTPGRGARAGFVRPVPALRAMVSFRQLNLVHPWPMHGPFDLVFCRNVAIYFDRETQRRLFERLADILARDGKLFIGHSEALFKVTDRFRLIGKTVYEKVR